MANLDFNEAYTSTPVTNASIAYANEQTDFVADKIFPTVFVEKDAGKIYSYGKQALRVYNAEKATGGSYNEVKFGVSATDTYFLQKKGLFTRLDSEDIENAEAPINAKIDSAEILTQNMLIERELVASQAINATNITQNVTLSGTSQFGNDASSPFEVIKTAKDTIYNASGKEANSIMIPRNVLETLALHPDVIARFPNAVMVTGDMIKDKMSALFGIENVYVGRAQAVITNLDEDDADDVITSIWGKNIVVFYSETSPKLKSLSFGKTYTKRGGQLRGEVMEGEALGETRLTHDAQALVAVKTKYDQVIQNAECAYLIIDAIA